MKSSPALAITTKPTALSQRYLDVRSTTAALCAPLLADDQMVQSMPDASPTKWHQAHTTWFFETFVLTPHLRDYRPFHERFRFLFNSYYKQLEQDASAAHPLRAIRGTFSRPTLEEVCAYRSHVDEAMLRFLDSEESSDPGVSALVELGINHEQQHQELIFTDIKHAFWTNPLRPPYRSTPMPVSDRRHSAHSAATECEGGLQWIGHGGAGFAFDNEGPEHQVFLRPFRIAARLVTNGEYIDFMQDGGYRRPELWLSDGWDTVQVNRWTAPLYWEQHDKEWQLFTLNGMREVHPEEPVTHVSYYEADAYARWAGARLPLESEWEVVAGKVPVKGNLLESNRLHPSPAAATEGIEQMFGDVWEWTGSPYVSYPGYRPPSGVVGEYNAKFMCNQMVLRGGSCVTPASHIRATYRNFFPPHTRWQFSGIRLVNERS